MRENASHILLLTGKPGIGKTTVIRKLAAGLKEKKIAGFYTQEIRKQGVRKGFQLTSFNGVKFTLAHVDFPKQFRVSKYGVDIKVLDNIAEKLLTPEQDAEIFLVDEIGKMECYSDKFIATMRRLLNSNKVLVATIALRGSGFIDEVKQRDDVLLWEIIHTNRDVIPQQVLNWLQERN